MSKRYEITEHVWGTFGGEEFDLEPGPASDVPDKLLEHLISVLPAVVKPIVKPIVEKKELEDG